jgi:dihydrofolate reductase
MVISIIAATDKNRGLGFGNKLPWHLPDDLKRFKELTKGHAVIMGRKTFESIGRPLPDRKNIVISRNTEYVAPGCVVVGSMDAALAEAGKDADPTAEVFIIGGGEIYNLGLQYAHKMYLTSVDTEIPADVRFPEFNEREWSLVATEFHQQDEKHPHPFTFKIYEKK